MCDCKGCTSHLARRRCWRLTCACHTDVSPPWLRLRAARLLQSPPSAGDEMATAAMIVMQPRKGSEIPTWHGGDAGARHVPATRALHCRCCNGTLRGSCSCPLGPGSGCGRPFRHRHLLHCRGRCLLFVSLLSLRGRTSQVSCRSFGSRPICSHYLPGTSFTNARTYDPCPFPHGI